MRFGRSPPLKPKVCLVSVGLLIVSASAPADGPRDEALRALRDQAAAIEAAVRAAAPPAWLQASPQAKGYRAGEAAGRVLLERFPEPASGVGACLQDAPRCSPALAPAKPANIEAEAVARGQVRGNPPPTPTTLRDEDITVTVLVSRSLGEAQLKAIFAFAAATPGVRVAFRGLVKDESLGDFIRAIHGLLAGVTPVPEVVLDPTPFPAAGVAIAPVLIAAGPDGELARVSGLADPAWLRARVLAGQRGDLGVRGPVVEVVEPDLIAALKRRLAQLDLGSLRERALARYWKRVPFEVLPVAAAARTRTLDPTITAASDIRLPNGSLLVRAGDTVNPLDRLPFTARLVVFDATDPRQVKTALRLGRDAGTRHVVYLATHLARSWEGLAAAEDALDSPVYLLTSDVRGRFALERTPAYVEANGRVFVVAEVPPEDGP
jgi:conjugal transfer pilus assembly protein TraW